MFHTRNSSQHQAEFVLLDQLVEEDHLLRPVDQYIDFSFIINKVKPYYSEKLCRFKTTAWASLLPVEGKQNVSEQVLLTAACQNMKKIATHLAKLG